MLDYETAKAYESALKKAYQDFTAVEKKKGVSVSDIIQKECEIVNRFLDAFFGEGTSGKLFQGKMNLNVSMNAFEAVVEESIRQRKAFESNTKRITEKWKAC